MQKAIIYLNVTKKFIKLNNGFYFYRTKYHTRILTKIIPLKKLLMYFNIFSKILITIKKHFGKFCF